MNAQITRGDSAADLGGGLSEAALPAKPAEPEATSRPTSRMPASGWRYTFSSLENRDFRFLLLSLLFMMGGQQMGGLALGYLVYQLTSSAFILGLMGAGAGISILIFALFGGAVADRMDRKQVIQVGQGAAVLLALFIALSIVSGTVTWVHLLAAALLEGALFSFVMPARQAIIPQLVGPGRVTNAMGLSAAEMGATGLVAPVLAGTLYARIGPGGLYFVVAGMGVVALALSSFLPKVRRGARMSQDPILREIMAGLAYIWHSPLLVVLLVMGLAAALFAVPFRTLLPVFVVDLYHRGPESMGLLIALTGAGALAGSLFIASLGVGRRGMMMIIGSFVSGAALLLVALIPIYFAALGIVVLVGLGDAARRALNQAIVMEHVEDRYRGRVMSVFMMAYGLMPLGLVPAAIVTELMGAQVAIGALAVLLLATSTTILLTQKRLRDLQ